MTNVSPIIVAIDTPHLTEAKSLAQALNPNRCRLKVGKELFTAHGPHAVECLQNLGYDVFLDLKFHDIPNTVAQALKSAAALGVWMINVHLSGGRRMLEASVEALAVCSHRPFLVGVTVLTSLESLDFLEMGINIALEDQVMRLGQLAKTAGLDGVVCSAREAASLRLGWPEAVLVTPGIRLQSRVGDDQRRVLTPQAAIEQGSDYLVIGRPITQSDDPAAVLTGILRNLSP